MKKNSIKRANKTVGDLQKNISIIMQNRKKISGKSLNLVHWDIQKGITFKTYLVWFLEVILDVAAGGSCGSANLGQCSYSVLK